MVKIGDRFKIPNELCGHTGRISGMSSDGKSIYVKCEMEHSVDPLTKEPYFKRINGFNKPVTKTGIVYILDNPGQ